jgi:hypothetical protein
VLFVSSPVMNVVFHTTPLSLRQWLMATALATTVIPAVNAQKWWYERHPGRAKPSRKTR